MFRFKILGAVFLLSSLISNATVIEVSDLDQLNKDVLNTNKPAIIKVGATWCPACVRSKAPFKKISDDFDEVIFAEVDADASPDIVAKYGVGGLPTFIYVQNGQVVKSEAGYSDNLRNDIKKFVEGTKAPSTTVEKKTEEAGQLQADQPEAKPEVEATSACAPAPESFLERAYNAVTGFFTSIFDTVSGWFR